MPNPFLVGSIGGIPVNQLDALPLQTAANYVSGGSFTLVGGVIFRYFEPGVVGGAGLGVNGKLMNVADPLDLAHAYILTNYIDVTGCKCFTLAAVARTPDRGMGAPGTGANTSNWSVYWQSACYDDTGTVRDIRTGNDGVVASALCGTIKFNAIPDAGPPYPEKIRAACCSWQVGMYNGGGNNAPGGLGVGRLFMSGDGIDPCYLTLQLWASS